jgi:hypothetical protein
MAKNCEMIKCFLFFSCVNYTNPPVVHKRSGEGYTRILQPNDQLEVPSWGLLASTKQPESFGRGEKSTSRKDTSFQET